MNFYAFLGIIAEAGIKTEEKLVKIRRGCMGVVPRAIPRMRKKTKKKAKIIPKRARKRNENLGLIMLNRSRFVFQLTTQMLFRKKVLINEALITACTSNLCFQRSEISSQSVVPKEVDKSYIKKFMKAVGWMDQNRTRLKLTGYFVYENIHANIAHEEWFDKLELPDTFASWFNVTELHVWLLMLRYMEQDVIQAVDKITYVKGDGYFVRNCIVEALWADVGNRVKLLEGANPTIARQQISEISEQFQAALIAYDEGLSDDKIMAAAIWRRFYALSPDAKFDNIEKIVHFIRHQIAELHKIPDENLKWKPDIPWLSIVDH